MVIEGVSDVASNSMGRAAGLAVVELKSRLRPPPQQRQLASQHNFCVSTLNSRIASAALLRVVRRLCM